MRLGGRGFIVHFVIVREEWVSKNGMGYIVPKVDSEHEMGFMVRYLDS